MLYALDHIYTRAEQPSKTYDEADGLYRKPEEPLRARWRSSATTIGWLVCDVLDSRLIARRSSDSW